MSCGCLPIFLGNAGLIVARNPEHLPLAFNVLIATFDRAGLKTNTTKTEGIVFLPGRIRTPLTSEAYKARMVDAFQTKKSERKVTCPSCPTILAAGSLRSHHATQHNVYQCFIIKELQQGSLLTPTRYASTLAMEDGKWRYPVPDCPQGREGHGCDTSFNLRWHFTYQPPARQVDNLQQDFRNVPLYGMQVSPTVLGTPTHDTSKN